MITSASNLRTAQVVALALATVLLTAEGVAQQRRSPQLVDLRAEVRTPATTTNGKAPVVQPRVVPQNMRYSSLPAGTLSSKGVSNARRDHPSLIQRLTSLQAETKPNTATAALASPVQQVSYEAERPSRKCRHCGEDQDGGGCQCANAQRTGSFPGELASPVSTADYLGGGPGELAGSRKAMAGFVPWWQREIAKPQRQDSQPLAFTLDEIILQAVEHSHFIRAQSNLPLMSEEAILEAAAEFDVSAFTQSRFTRTSEPIGSTLTAGPGRTRYRDKNWNHEAGIRKKTYNGAALELGQRYGYQRNNSDFLNPNPQSTTQLALRFSQPLLRGSGKVYNSSLILLAQFDKNIAWDKFSRELQNHLVEVSNAYWQLYLQRAILLQRQRHFERATVILKELETRADIDAARSQIVRAQAAVASRRSDLTRAHSAVQNAQARLRALVNAPELDSLAIELVPSEQPNPQFIEVSMQDALVTALENRPEIDESMQQLRSAKFQVSVSQHELLPTLDLVTETYVSGLQPGASVGQSWVDQFRVGEPSYSVGIEMEVPLHNRAAKARNRRKLLQLKWIVSRYKDTLANLNSEVEIVVRDVHTTYDEMIGKYHAMQATLAELNYLSDRWRLLPGDDRSSSFLLEDILDIQNRLVGHEFELARAQVAYTQSLVELKRATGTLLESQQVSATQFCECGVPQLHLSKTPLENYAEPVTSVYESRVKPRAKADPIISDPVLTEPAITEPAIPGPIVSQPKIEAYLDERWGPTAIEELPAGKRDSE